MKLTDGFTDNFKFKPGKSRRYLIARLVKNSQTKIVACIRCESGKCLQSDYPPVCLPCRDDLQRPLDVHSFPR